MKEQENFLKAMDYAQSVPSLSQAQRIKALSKSGKLTLEEMQDILRYIMKEGKEWNRKNLLFALI